RTITIANRGNASLTGGAGSDANVVLTSTAPLHFGFPGASTSGLAAAGGGLSRDVVFTPSGAQQTTTFMGTISVAPDQVSCAPLPAAIVVSGVGNADACTGVDFQTDPRHCGACGVHCEASGTSCVAGECLLASEIELSSSDVFWKVSG